MPAQLTEVGFDMPTLLNIDPDAGYMQESPTEYAPGSAAAYGGDDGENSVDVDIEIQEMKTAQPDVPLSDLTKMGTTLDHAVRQWDTHASKSASEPCGLTIAEWEAHKAQMAADQAHQSESKMMHLGLAALAGFVVSRLVR